MIFGPLSESAGVQNGAQNRPSGAKMPIQKLRGCSQKRSWNRLASRIVFGALLAPTLVDFGWNFDEMSMKVCIIFRDLLLHFSRIFLPTPAQANFQNKQKPAETRPLSKRSVGSTPVNHNLQPPKRQQLQQTPSYKIGGGGTRAAWRIQITI